MSTHQRLLFSLLLLPDHIVNSPATKPHHNPGTRSNKTHCSDVSANGTITPTIAPTLPRTTRATRRLHTARPCPPHQNLSVIV